jgi:hypothetical protein
MHLYGARAPPSSPEGAGIAGIDASQSKSSSWRGMNEGTRGLSTTSHETVSEILSQVQQVTCGL